MVFCQIITTLCFSAMNCKMNPGPPQVEYFIYFYTNAGRIYIYNHISYIFRACSVVMGSCLSSHSTTYHRLHHYSGALESTDEPRCWIYLALYNCVSLLRCWHICNRGTNNTSNVQLFDYNLAPVVCVKRVLPCSLTLSNSAGFLLELCIVHLVVTLD